MGVKPFATRQQMFDGGNPYGRRYYWKSDYFDALSPSLADEILTHTEELPSPNCVTLCFHLGGQISRTPNDHSAAAHRDANYVLNVTAGWDDPSLDSDCLQWTRSYHAATQPHSTGGVYVNFLAEDEGVDRVKAAYDPEKFARLAQLKRTWDPDHLFRVNKNIPPASD